MNANKVLDILDNLLKVEDEENESVIDEIMKYTQEAITKPDNMNEYLLSINNMGQMYHYGYGFQKNEDVAKTMYLIAANMGCVEGEFNIGLLYDRRKEYDIAEMWYKKAAHQNHILAMYNLAVLYQWFTKAKDLGDIDAMLELSDIYEDELGDIEQAKKYCKQAADMGCLRAQEKMKLFSRKLTDIYYDICNVVGNGDKIMFNSNCGICFDPLMGTYSGIMILNCGHIFHTICINKLDHKCPMKC